VRLPRTLTIDGRLTRYQSQQSQWQSRFYNTTDFGTQREYGEQFVHVFPLSDRHFVLLTTERLYFFHSPIRKCQLPSEEIWDNDDDHGGTGEFRNQQDLILMNCPIQQLQIIQLDSFYECNHHRMMLQDGEYFLKTQSCCTDLTSMIGTQMDDSSTTTSSTTIICHFIEFRQTPMKSMSNRMSPVHGGQQSQPILLHSSLRRNSNQEDYYNHGGKHGRQQQQNFEYPSQLNPCYCYCDSTQMIQRIIQLIHEAKHLQEERKFEVSNLWI
ncbi:hypothetical protein BLA29_007647, partial [Euroglyphus maynei]